ncbi:hypothetical protein VE01_03488 [Pseudogymnoascus verrucosus]|uniref:Major facilitator superfamily (MFS) profile domain-containing protein n=1 Tax=Pseudogymnoascus verrucosus TaxID=342668 RepID=A0A1B8GRM4_9PEZI|nr:uncharacterized protein VE01_03488 [Pseudogymnoascus verrucosus]OBT98489.1 hypothetical protein VE01_03488 [Pseudogymnoascus verrucosus]
MLPPAKLPNRGPAVELVALTTLGIATLFVVARLVTRLGIVKRSTLDDLMIVVGWTLALGVTLSITIGVAKGLGRHDVDIPPQSLDDLRKCEYTFSVLYNPALMATKTSILIFYLCLSKNMKYFRLATYLTIAVVIIAGTILTFFNIFVCDPITKTFSNSSTQKCIRLVTLYFAASPTNVATDIVILILPIPILTGMQLPRKQKVILVFTFALGIFVMIVDVIRINALQNTILIITAGGPVPTTTDSLEDTTDFAYLVSPALMWSAVEINVGIICACIPTLRPLVKRVVPWLIEQVGSHSSDGLSKPKPKPWPENQTLDVQVTTNGSWGVTAPTEDRPIHPDARDSDIQLEFLTENNIAAQEQTLDVQVTTNGSWGVTAPTEDRPIHPDARDSDIQLEFLTENNIAAREQTLLSVQPTGTAVYFGFVNLQPPKCMLRMSVSDSWKYCSVVTILFFLWGFSNGLLNALNIQISTIAQLTFKQSLSLSTAFYGGYIIGPFTVGWYALKEGGFKIIFIVSLCIYGIGSLMLWPSASFISLPGFLVSNVVAAIGLSSLEMAANSFITLCGPPQYGEMRLLFAQAMQALGATVSELIADKAFAPLIQTKKNLIHVQWTYFTIALFTIVIALFYHYMPLPEASDDDLQEELQPDLLPMNRMVKTTSLTHIGGIRVVFLTLALGVMVQSIYILSQVAFDTWYIYVLAPPPAEHKIDGLNLSPRNYLLLAYSLKFFSRVIGGALCFVMWPRLILLLSLAGALTFTIAFVALPEGRAAKDPNLVAGLGMMVFFFLAPVFPLVYSITLRGMGKNTRLAAAMLTASISLGAVGPWIIFGAMRKWRLRESFWVIIFWLGIALVFPVYLSVSKKARSVVDWKVKDRRGEERPKSQRRQNGVLTRRRRSDEDEERGWGR